MMMTNIRGRNMLQIQQYRYFDVDRIYSCSAAVASLLYSTVFLIKFNYTGIYHNIYLIIT